MTQLAIDTVYFGEPVTIGTTAPFRNALGVAVDPDVVIITVKAPDGLVAELTGNDLGNPETGMFEVTIIPDVAGAHGWRIEGTGNGADDVQEGIFYVLSSVTG